MQMIVAVIKPNKVEAVKTGLAAEGILGLTATEAKGFAKQMGTNEREGYRASKMDTGLVPKMLILVCVKDHEKDLATKIIVENARTGGVGDGKVFVFPVPEVIRIRTGERDDDAL